MRDDEIAFPAFKQIQETRLPAQRIAHRIRFVLGLEPVRLFGIQELTDVRLREEVASALAAVAAFVLGFSLVGAERAQSVVPVELVVIGRFAPRYGLGRSPVPALEQADGEIPSNRDVVNRHGKPPLESVDGVIECVRQNQLAKRTSLNEVDEVGHAGGDDHANRRSDGQGDVAGGNRSFLLGFLVGKSHGLEKGFHHLFIVPRGGVMLRVGQPHTEVEHALDEGIADAGLGDLPAQVDVIDAEENIAGEPLVGVRYV